MDLHTPFLEILARLSLAVVFGGLLGWERERKRKAAGFRTQMMVSLGAATFTLISIELYQTALVMTDEPRVDFIRIIEGVAGGIGFLGAGTIIRARGSVEGITTAATIWVVGAIGIACGAGYYLLAGIAVAFALMILTMLAIFERRVVQNHDSAGSHIESHGGGREREV